MEWLVSEGTLNKVRSESDINSAVVYVAHAGQILVEGYAESELTLWGHWIASS